MAVGVFDSGIGGMTVVREIRKRFPNEKIIYFGDTKRVPYGEKTQEELISFSEQIVSFLISQGAKVIVDACNTTSALALPYLKKKFDIPIIGVLEPGANKAVDVAMKKIGLIATSATINSNSYQKSINILKSDIEVTAVACPKLVGFIEDGDLNSDYLKKVLNNYLNTIFLNNCDTLILGCTHYPFLTKTIAEIIGEDIKLVDPAISTVDILEKYLDGSHSEEICYVSGDYHSFNNTLMKLYPKHGFEKIVEFDPIK
ncbi:MAG: glutamate racemase [Firmicutes bacterium]|nr:glutamate racemase [Bacillota bacterium]